jgi:hypothetical protein
MLNYLPRRPLGRRTFARQTLGVCQPANTCINRRKERNVFHKGAQVLANVLSNAQHKILSDQHLGSVVMAPKAFTDELIEFYKSCSKNKLSNSHASTNRVLSSDRLSFVLPHCLNHHLQVKYPLTKVTGYKLIEWVHSKTSGADHWPSLFVHV